MIPGNNFSELKELRAIQDQIMDCISRTDDMLRRNSDLDQMKALWRSINKQQANYTERVHTYLTATHRALQLLHALEGKEDELQARLFAASDMTLEEVDQAKACMVSANESLTGFMRRFREILSRDREKVNA